MLIASKSDAEDIPLNVSIRISEDDRRDFMDVDEISIGHNFLEVTKDRQVLAFSLSKIISYGYEYRDRDKDEH